MNRQLNYHHLRYFLAVADYGGIKAASDHLHVSAPTLSAQVKELEQVLETDLFLREGKRMILTDSGRTVQQYAARIFSLGDEMLSAVRQGKSDSKQTILLGLADTVPKLLASRLVQRCWKELPTLHVVIREGMPDELYPVLAAHQLDLVIANEPPPAIFKSLLSIHQTALFSILLLASPKVCAEFRAKGGLNHVPMLVPPRESALRRELEQWWSRDGIVPWIRAEFDDSAAMFELASAGMGAAPAIGPVVKDIKSRYGLVELPVRTGIHESLYVVRANHQYSHSGIRLFAEFAMAVPDWRRL